MELKLTRLTFTDKSTISELSVDGKYQCYVLEDVVREGPKVYGQTAIPYGRYKIDVTYSNRFKRDLPLLLEVPNFEGIRIHPGNSPQNTEGCLLPGRTSGLNWVGESRAAFNELFDKIDRAVENDEEVWITVVDGREVNDPSAESNFA
jgi:hypothetical protein